MEELRASIAYEDAPEAERDYAAAFAALPRISWQGHCMYCGHCAPCPQVMPTPSRWQVSYRACRWGSMFTRGAA
mgnify:CR=1 FL=1